MGEEIVLTVDSIARILRLERDVGILALLSLTDVYEGFLEMGYEVSGKDIKEEITKTKKEDWLRFQNMDPSISGRYAEGVRRDKKTGARLSKDEIKSLQKQDEKPKEIKLEWGKGLAQKREAEARLQELELEKAKPFARTRDDDDLNNILKNAVRWGDPMAHLVKKKHSEVVLPDIGDNERMKESGFIIPQEVPKHSWLKWGLDAAPNGYGIRAAGED
ncbi:hypothetical protein QVD17_19628 [Tagetes erecta]|uniref:Uncharacterized protein n=1 Tax=Tagetes erecta TaxID=13708 RepID=A0AAD8KND2_TARER|nr:hypothetical protein QVD17_19628 [Tagetes erecta]